jgi:nucleoside 2-deoxyribosyltransferase
MNAVFHNDDINFAILAEIRRAQFIVADITGARGGVYFEAGFAKALGRDAFQLPRRSLRYRSAFRY